MSLLMRLIGTVDIFRSQFQNSQPRGRNWELLETTTSNMPCRSIAGQAGDRV